MIFATSTDKKLVNRYDMLGPFNLRETFGDGFWKWPFPVTSTSAGQGLYYPKIPEVAEHVKEQLKNPNKNIYKTLQKLEEDPNVYLQQALKKYQGQNLIVN